MLNYLLAWFCRNSTEAEIPHHLGCTISEDPVNTGINSLRTNERDLLCDAYSQNPATQLCSNIVPIMKHDCESVSLLSLPCKDFEHLRSKKPTMDAELWQDSVHHPGSGIHMDSHHMLKLLVPLGAPWSINLCALWGSANADSSQ